MGASLLAKDLRKFAPTDLYRGLVWLTDGLLTDDAKLLSKVSSS